jgi:hypothetical protein
MKDNWLRFVIHSVEISEKSQKAGQSPKRIASCFEHLTPSGDWDLFGA